MRRLTIAFTVALFTAGFAACMSDDGAATASLRVGLTVAESIASAPLDGRLLLLIAADDSKEPRFQVADSDRTAQVFGIDAEGLRTGQEVFVDATTPGYPVQNLADLRPGEYWVQGLLHVYDTFKRGDGRTVKLPPDRGEGQQWNQAPGNLYSSPRKVRIDPASREPIHITLDRKVPPLPDLPETKYVKRIRLQSERQMAHLPHVFQSAKRSQTSKAQSLQVKKLFSSYFSRYAVSGLEKIIRQNAG